MSHTKAEDHFYMIAEWAFLQQMKTLSDVLLVGKYEDKCGQTVSRENAYIV